MMTERARRVKCEGCLDVYADYDCGEAFGHEWCYRCLARRWDLRLVMWWRNLKSEFREDVSALRVLGLRRFGYSHFFYRAHMRLIHRMHFCHMKPMLVDDPGGRRQHWCQWCGMRGYK